MITDNRGTGQYKIINCSNTHTTIHTQNNGKIIYKQFSDVSSSNQEKLCRWMQFNHSNILPVYRVHKTEHIDGLFGLYYQHFTTNMLQFMGGKDFVYDEDDIVNTFHPIVEALDYLCNNQFEVCVFGLANIVITEQQDIKFVDSSILDPQFQGTRSNNKQQIFKQLSEIVFHLLLDTLKNKQKKITKSSKNRIRIIENNFSKQTWSFYKQIFNRSKGGSIKTKKITKCNKKLQGKQNFILQQKA